MLSKPCKRPIATHTPASGILVRSGWTLVSPLSALAFFLTFCSVAGCKMCQNSTTGVWTELDAGCGPFIGDKCVSDLGDWMTWDACCSANRGALDRQRDLQSVSSKTSMDKWLTAYHWVNQLVHRRPDAAPRDLQSVSGTTSMGKWLTAFDWVKQLVHERPDAPHGNPNSIVGLSQVLPAMRSCDCTQVRQTGGCSLNATSKCSEQCCMESSCECSRARFGCGSPDGSRCWGHCCIKSTKACDCNFARAGGCGMRDHNRECWDTCCAAYAQATPVWEWAKQKLCASVFASPLAWACVVALGVLLLNSRRVTLAIGYVTTKAVWKPVATCSLEEDIRGLLG